jgi:Xaa-Pro dipeptidase
VYLVDPKHAKYINKDMLEQYYPVGGVRIEDDILVTSTGYENLTTAPKGEEACEIIRRGSSGKCGRGPPEALK